MVVGGSAIVAAGCYATDLESRSRNVRRPSRHAAGPRWACRERGRWAPRNQRRSAEIGVADRQQLHQLGTSGQAFGRQADRSRWPLPDEKTRPHDQALKCICFGPETGSDPMRSVKSSISTSQAVKPSHQFGCQCKCDSFLGQTCHKPDYVAHQPTTKEYLTWSSNLTPPA